MDTAVTPLLFEFHPPEIDVATAATDAACPFQPTFKAAVVHFIDGEAENEAVAFGGIDADSERIPWDRRLVESLLGGFVTTRLQNGACQRCTAMAGINPLEDGAFATLAVHAEGEG